MKPENISSLAERRRYARLDHIFPVEFQFLDQQRKPLSRWYQAFSQDISQGGLCLTVNNLSAGDVVLLEDKQVLMALVINVPVGSEAIRATAKAAWFKKLKDEPFQQYAIGVSYETIEPKDNRRILRYANTRRFLKALAITFSLFLSLGLVGIGAYNTRLRFENEKLLASLSQNFGQQRALKQSRDDLKSQIDEMKFLLSQSDRKIGLLEEQLSRTKSEDSNAVGDLAGTLDFLKKNQEQLKANLLGLEAQKAQVDGDVTAKAQEASLLQGRILDKLYRWLKTHQNNLTGLVVSYEGDSDINDWAFTYDQALAAIAFVYSGDAEDARKIFDFYLRAPKSDDGGLANAYYASTGEISEFIAHAGPNIWMGLAMLQYTHNTRDTRYLNFARGLAEWLQTVRDNEGGLRGGKALTWYSTEHNLDAYAFYEMLYDLTKEDVYNKRAMETLAWLNKNAFSRLNMPVVKRGKGDSTIATDTYAWSITAIGPQKLKGIGMDPDGILDFAIDNCGVTVEYKKPEGPVVSVRGFDFAKHQNLGRGGVISCEWTSQMVLALKIMADYYVSEGNEEKSRYYSDLASGYVSDLSKMIITSPSPVGQGDFCLPYASQEFADTGHGWRTPKGARTGSVAATAYTILMMKDLNPLRFNGSKAKAD